MAVSITTGGWNNHRNFKAGPFEWNGALFVVAKNTSQSMVVYRSTNNGITWSDQSGIAPSNTTGGVVQDGKYLYFPFAVTSDTVMYLRRFDMETSNVDILTSTGSGVTHVNVSGSHPIFPVVRSNGNLVVFHQGETERVMGNDYRRVAYSIWNGSSWTTVVPAVPHATSPGTPDNTGDNHYDARGAVLGESDRVHFVYQTGLSSAACRSFTLRADNTTSSYQVLQSATSFPSYPVGGPASGGGDFAFLSSRQNRPSVRRAPSVDTPSSGIFDNYLSEDNVRVDTSNPGALAIDSEGVWHAVYVRDDNGNIEYTNNQGTWDWTTPELFAESNTQGISAAFLPSMNAIGVLFNDGGTVKFEALQLAAPPDAPTLLTPEDNASIDGSSQNTFTWSFQGDGSQEEFAFRRDYDEFITQPSNFSLLDTPNFDTPAPQMGLSPDNQHVALGATSLTPTFNVYETTNWTKVIAEKTLNGAIQDVAWSPDGAFVAVAATGNPAVTLFNTNDWSEVSLGIAFSDGVRVDFSPDGRYLALCGHSTAPRLRIFDRDDNWSQVSHDYSLILIVERVRFSPDGNYLAYGRTNAVSFMNLNTMTTEKTVATSGNCRDLAWSGDSSLVYAYFSQVPRITRIDVAAGEVVATMNNDTIVGNSGRMLNYKDEYLIVSSFHQSAGGVQIATLWPTFTTFTYQRGHLPGFTSNPTSMVFFGDDLLAVRHTQDGVYKFTQDVTEHWNGSAWQSNEIWIPSSDEQVTFPAGAWE